MRFDAIFCNVWRHHPFKFLLDLNAYSIFLLNTSQSLPFARTAFGALHYRQKIAYTLQKK